MCSCVSGHDCKYNASCVAICIISYATCTASRPNPRRGKSYIGLLYFYYLYFLFASCKLRLHTRLARPLVPADERGPGRPSLPPLALGPDARGAAGWMATLRPAQTIARLRGAQGGASTSSHRMAARCKTSNNNNNVSNRAETAAPCTL